MGTKTLQVTHAVWEQRNLGVDTWEITLDADDTLADFLEAEKEIVGRGADYIVVRTPNCRTDFLEGLSSAGYCFREAALEITLKKRNYHEHSITSRLGAGMVVNEVIGTQANRVIREVKNGVFSTDRISLDSRFSQEQAAFRYAYWLEDMIARGDKLLEFKVDDEPFGFSAVHDLGSNIAYPTLTGLYRNHIDSGLGLVLIAKLSTWIFENGYKTSVTTVVSNNPSVLRANLLLGATITDIRYIYTKHLVGV